IGTFTQKYGVSAIKKVNIQWLERKLANPCLGGDFKQSGLKQTIPKWVGIIWIKYKTQEVGMSNFLTNHSNSFKGTKVTDPLLKVLKIVIRVTNQKIFKQL
ncbi:hypothetical protein, partial [Labrenzia sp. 011]|uniref:hypothetical protein n=1 Tax=Labrenzia sp. 011 TaxID=2171494 RepID=UPI001FCB44E0